MVGSSKNIDRDKMAVELYFSVLRIKRNEGLPLKEAKDLAYDAVELRYNISAKRLQNIISENHDTLNCNKHLFLSDNRKLIEVLRESNANMQGLINRNNELLKILEGVCHV